MKTPKPGQFTAIVKTIYRAYKRTDGCNGCVFNNAFSCPRIVDPRSEKDRIECLEYNIILKKCGK